MGLGSNFQRERWSLELGCMEDLTPRCDRLSLSAMEDKKIITRRALNIEVVVCTFRTLWRTKEGFEVTNAGNNVLLFAFEREVDAEKVLLGEPLSYDRHLVVLEQFDEEKTISKLEFKLCSFWVQLHHLPFKFMSLETVLVIGETIRPISWSHDIMEMKGGSFMRVQTIIDILIPLCRGCRGVVESCLMMLVRAGWNFNMNDCQT